MNVGKILLLATLIASYHTVWGFEAAITIKSFDGDGNVVSNLTEIDSSGLFYSATSSSSSMNKITVRVDFEDGGSPVTVVPGDCDASDFDVVSGPLTLDTVVSQDASSCEIKATPTGTGEIVVSFKSSSVRNAADTLSVNDASTVTFRNAIIPNVEVVSTSSPSVTIALDGVATTETLSAKLKLQYALSSAISSNIVFVNLPGEGGLTATWTLDVSDTTEPTVLVTDLPESSVSIELNSTLQEGDYNAGTLLVAPPAFTFEYRPTSEMEFSLDGTSFFNAPGSKSVYVDRSSEESGQTVSTSNGFNEVTISFDPADNVTYSVRYTFGEELEAANTSTWGGLTGMAGVNVTAVDPEDAASTTTTLTGVFYSSTETATYVLPSAQEAAFPVVTTPVVGVAESFTVDQSADITAVEFSGDRSNKTNFLYHDGRTAHPFIRVVFSEAVSNIPTGLFVAKDPDTHSDISAKVIESVTVSNDRREVVLHIVSSVTTFYISIDETQRAKTTPNVNNQFGDSTQLYFTLDLGLSVDIREANTSSSAWADATVISDATVNKEFAIIRWTTYHPISIPFAASVNNTGYTVLGFKDITNPTVQSTYKYEFVATSFTMNTVNFVPKNTLEPADFANFNNSGGVGVNIRPEVDVTFYSNSALTSKIDSIFVVSDSAKTVWAVVSAPGWKGPFRHSSTADEWFPHSNNGTEGLSVFGADADVVSASMGKLTLKLSMFTGAVEDSGADATYTAGTIGVEVDVSSQDSNDDFYDAPDSDQLWPSASVQSTIELVPRMKLTLHSDTSCGDDSKLNLMNGVYTTLDKDLSVRLVPEGDFNITNFTPADISNTVGATISGSNAVASFQSSSLDVDSNGYCLSILAFETDVDFQVVSIVFDGFDKTPATTPKFGEEASIVFVFDNTPKVEPRLTLLDTAGGELVIQQNTTETSVVVQVEMLKINTGEPTTYSGLPSTFAAAFTLEQQLDGQNAFTTVDDSNYNSASTITADTLGVPSTAEVCYTDVELTTKYTESDVSIPRTKLFCLLPFRTDDTKDAMRTVGSGRARNLNQGDLKVTVNGASISPRMDTPDALTFAVHRQGCKISKKPTVNGLEDWDGATNVDGFPLNDVFDTTFERDSKVADNSFCPPLPKITIDPNTTPVLTVQDANGEQPFELELPEGAFDSSVDLTLKVAEVSDQPDSETKLVSEAIEITKSTGNFQKKVNLRFKLKVPVNTRRQVAQVFYKSSVTSPWLPLDDAEYNPVDNTVRASTDHFTIFGVFLRDRPQQLEAGGGCDNKCSGHGECSGQGECICWPSWQGFDCSERQCSSGVAFANVHNPNPHHHLECSGKGICDRETGECQCFEGYDGEACHRRVCPNDCSGHGKCRLVSDIADMVEVPEYLGWDADSIQTCVCDGGYFGADCSQRRCPRGDDPLTQCHPSSTNQVQKVEIKFGAEDVDVTTAVNDDLALAFEDMDGEVWQTSRISGIFAGSATSNIETALESLPNYIIDNVAVSVDPNQSGNGNTNRRTYFVTFTGSSVSGNQRKLICPDEAPFGVDYGCMTAGCQPMFKQPRIIDYDYVGTEVVVTDDSVLRPKERASAAGQFDIAFSVEINTADSVDRLGNPIQQFSVTAEHSALKSDTIDDEVLVSNELIPSHFSHVEIGYGVFLKFASRAPGIGIYKIYYSVPICTVTVGTSASSHAENAECSGRGLCNRETGECECIEGYTGRACNELNILL